MEFSRCPYLRGNVNNINKKEGCLFCEASKETVSYGKYQMVCFNKINENGEKEYEKWCSEYKERQSLQYVYLQLQLHNIENTLI
ncbi:MAG: hypothetical protein GX238_02155 [Epulopiscium sp.]|nr:hypothetical protein [Candidatus Epulonipiscium sp.]